MTPLIIATENKGKAQEIAELFSRTDYDVHFLFEYADILNGLIIQENAKSFEGNALIKAIIIGEKLKMLTLADDSGLCIDALNGRPGVYSARYSDEKTDAANIKKVLHEMENIPMEQRACHYECVVAIYDPATQYVETTCGMWHGRISLEDRGMKSFGYAPIFLSEESDYQKTNAESDAADLIAINHRGKAFREAIKALDRYITSRQPESYLSADTQSV